MSEVTLPSMGDARDAEDTRLLEEGNHQQLLESYYGTIIDRCRSRAPALDAIDVAGDVAVRLLSELKRGRRYAVPFRVVVHMVTTWKIKEYYQPARWKEVELDEHLAADDPLRGLEDDLDFDLDLTRLLDGLPARARDVAELRIRDELKPTEIAARLGIDRNAVDQAWHRATKILLERVAA
jgi:RNA polymerase sigma factor (sigma-70 family)